VSQIETDPIVREALARQVDCERRGTDYVLRDAVDVIGEQRLLVLALRHPTLRIRRATVSEKPNTHKHPNPNRKV